MGTQIHVRNQLARFVGDLTTQQEHDEAVVIRVWNTGDVPVEREARSGFSDFAWVTDRDRGLQIGFQDQGKAGAEFSFDYNLDIASLCASQNRSCSGFLLSISHCA